MLNSCYYICYTLSTAYFVTRLIEIFENTAGSIIENNNARRNLNWKRMCFFSNNNLDWQQISWYRVEYDLAEVIIRLNFLYQNCKILTENPLTGEPSQKNYLRIAPIWSEDIIRQTWSLLWPLLSIFYNLKVRLSLHLPFGRTNNRNYAPN